MRVNKNVPFKSYTGHNGKWDWIDVYLSCCTLQLHCSLCTSVMNKEKMRFDLQLILLYFYNHRATNTRKAENTESAPFFFGHLKLSSWTTVLRIVIKTNCSTWSGVAPSWVPPCWDHMMEFSFMWQFAFKLILIIIAKNKNIALASNA